MELKEIRCLNCKKRIYVQETHVRKQMFCTLGCLISYKDRERGKAHNLDVCSSDSFNSNRMNY